MFSKRTSVAAFSALLLASASAFAVKPSVAPTSLDCGAGDFTAAAGLTFVSCSGYWDQNLINDNDQSFVADQLAELGLTDSDGRFIEKLDNLNGMTTLSFDADQTPGTGTSTFWIGVHRGAGGTQGTQGTAFYKFTGTASVDALSYKLTGSSNAALYGTAPMMAAVPEPETYAMLLAGLAAVGFVARRRRV